MSQPTSLFQREDWEVIPDFWLIPGFFAEAGQDELVKTIPSRRSPLWTVPTMPGGIPFSIKTACFGWNWSMNGYTPAATPLPALLSEAAQLVWEYVGGKNPNRTYPPFHPQTAIFGWYSPESKLGNHIDHQEDPVLLLQGSPIVTIALGSTCVFQVRDQAPAEGKPGKLHSFRMHHGDAVVMFGAARLAEHGVREILPGTSPHPLINGRVSITIRQVKPLTAPQTDPERLAALGSEKHPTQGGPL